MLEFPVYQTVARNSESVGAAWRSIMEMVFRMPGILPQTSITIPLSDVSRW